MPLDARGGLTVEGELHGFKDQREYQVRGWAGQRLTIKVESHGGVRLIVVSPSGAEEGAPGGVIANLLLKESGTYKIRLTESPMGEDWRGSFRMTINLSKDPADEICHSIAGHPHTAHRARSIAAGLTPRRVAVARMAGAAV